MRIPHQSDTLTTLIRTLFSTIIRTGSRGTATQGVVVLVRGTRCSQVYPTPPHRFGLEIDPIGIAHQAIEDGIDLRRDGNQFLPVIHQQLTDHDAQAPAVAVIQLKHVAPLLGGEQGQPTAIKDQQVALGIAPHQLGQAPVAEMTRSIKFENVTNHSGGADIRRCLESHGLQTLEPIAKAIALKYTASTGANMATLLSCSTSTAKP